MAKLLGNLTYTIIAGVVLWIIVIAIMYGGYQVEFADNWWATLVRWLHIASGVMWIGLLWYFNFVQTPTMPKIPQEQRPTVMGFIHPVALFWFRWSAMSTIVFGIIMAWMNGYLGDAYALGLISHQPRVTQIGIGMWLATIMWFNVWFIIWPNQKVVMGIVQKSPEERTRAGRIAGQASRINTMLSIPMLWCMASLHTIPYV